MSSLSPIHPRRLALCVAVAALALLPGRGDRAGADFNVRWPTPAKGAQVNARAELLKMYSPELDEAANNPAAGRELAAKIDSKVIYSLIEQKLKEAQKQRS